MSGPTLRGKRALVTGAARRVGRAIALELAREGMDVAVHYRTSRDEAAATCDAIRALGVRAVALAADLADRAATRALVDEAVARLGGLDLLVPNAALFERIPFSAIDDAAWDRALETNLTSPFVLAERATPALRAARGSIVFVTCSSATAPFRHHLPYVVSKGAERHLMRTLALELAPDIRVNAVAPGLVLPAEDLSPEALERLRRRIPVGHWGSPEDVANAVVFLARSPFVTGQEIQVDGGRPLAG